MEIVTSVKDFQNLLSEKRNLGEEIGFIQQWVLFMRGIPH